MVVIQERLGLNQCGFRTAVIHEDLCDGPWMMTCALAWDSVMLEATPGPALGPGLAMTR